MADVVYTLCYGTPFFVPTTAKVFKIFHAYLRTCYWWANYS